jgi:DinB superfamily
VNRLPSRAGLAAALMLVLGSAVPARAEITPDERAKVVKYLSATRDQVLAESAKLSDAQWNFKAGPDRWSVGQVVEHLALAETFLLDAQKKALSGTPATAEQKAGAPGRDEMIMKVIPDRTKKVQAPEPLQPATKLGDQAAVLAAFRARREKTIEYAKTTKDDLRGHASESPLGALDAYQWLVFMGAHAERHLAQIKEVKADPKFPKAGTQ